jgi:hypothetical protein
MVYQIEIHVIKPIHSDPPEENGFGSFGSDLIALWLCSALVFGLVRLFDCPARRRRISVTIKFFRTTESIRFGSTRWSDPRWAQDES